MSKDKDFDDADDRLFNGKPLEDVEPDEVVAIEGDAETGFESVVEEPETETAEQPAETETQPAPEGDGDFQGLPPAAIAAMKDERRKTKEARDELQAMRDEVNQLKGAVQAQPAPQAQQQQAPQIPNPATDPQGYHDYMMAVQNHGLEIAALNLSESNTRRVHGNEAVDTAFAAVQSTGQADVLVAQFRQRPDPWGEMMVWHQQQKLLSEIGTDPEAYRAKIEAEVLAKLQGGGQPAPGQQPSASPQSGASPLPPRMGAQPGVASPGPAQHSMDDAEHNLWGR
ncbi:MAG: hypothetical protein AAGK02_07140 [Pseudomonadota bacterium]